MTAPLRTLSAAPTTVKVALGARSYDIVIGGGVIASLGSRIAALRPGAKTAIVTDETVARHHLAAAEAALAAAGVPSSSRHRSGRRRLEEFSQVPSRCAKRSSRRGSSGAILSSRSAAASSAIWPALRRRRCGAGSITCKCRPRCWPKSIPRSAARPRSIPPTARISSAPSISRSWCSPTPLPSTRCRRANSAPAMRRSPNTASSAMPPSSPGSRLTGARSSKAAILPEARRASMPSP